MKIIITRSLTLEIYLDNGATTKPFAISMDAFCFACNHEYGNSSSLHKKGYLASKLLTDAQQTVADSLGALPEEIVFTSGATESNNLAIIGTALAKKRQGNKIVTTSIEHPSVANTLTYLEQIGFEIVRVNPIDGHFTAQQFADVVDDNTILVTVMQVNNETGLILPVNEIAKQVKKVNKNVIVHSDGVQGYWLTLQKKYDKSNVISLEFIDLYTISGHKIYAPKGVGCLYIKKNTRLIAQIYGGSQQLHRAGTVSTPLIHAMSASVKHMQTINMVEHYSSLYDYLLTKISGIDFISHNCHNHCSKNIFSLSVKNIKSEVMLHFLEQFEIYVSSGSACSKGKKSDSVSNMGFEPQTTIRVSFGIDTTTDMLDILVDKIIEGHNSLSKI